MADRMADQVELPYTSFAAAPTLDAGSGISMRPVAGARIMLSEVTVPANTAADLHTHDEEKIGFVVSGSCDFEVDGAQRRLGPGEIYRVLPGTPHGLRAAGEGCVVVDVFSPPRADLLNRMSTG